jgi:aryl-alcohol dehydrogenase-like predicted oxidoreductase
MELRNLGASGLRVSAVGLGCNNLGGRLDGSASRNVVQAALNNGITLFDTADRYPQTSPENRKSCSATRSDAGARTS